MIKLDADFVVSFYTRFGRRVGRRVGHRRSTAKAERSQTPANHSQAHGSKRNLESEIEKLDKETTCYYVELLLIRESAQNRPFRVYA